MTTTLPHSPAPDTCVFYLVRHGATANNLETPPRLQGRRTNLPLSTEGRQQAESTAAFLADYPIDAFFSSPLDRAKQTAEIIAAGHEKKVHVVENLAECDVGLWEGRTWADIERDEPEAYRDFMTRPETHGYAGGENLAHLLQRVHLALDDLVARHAGQTICVVAHNVVNRAFIGDILGLPSAKARSVPQDNCGINLLRWRAGKFKVLSINARFHLGTAQ